MILLTTDLWKFRRGEGAVCCRGPELKSIFIKAIERKNGLIYLDFA
jgi:hypothetical protein